MHLNPLAHPIIFTNPARLATSSWVQHLPFGMLLIELLKPRVLVELGTHYGVSYCGFCQAVKTLQTDTWCYAVDSWKGDEHTGAYEAQVYEELRQHHDVRYSDFSQLLKMNFDDALPYFADRSIDLLHIDGYHTYEAVRHDFETWLPKLSDRAVVLIHDVNERDRQFGVWRFWDELKSRYPAFEMLHEHGLGVVAVGSQLPQALDFLLDAVPEERAQIREFFHLVGARLTAQMQEAEFVSRLQHVQNLETELANAQVYIASLKDHLEQQKIETRLVSERSAMLEAVLHQAQTELGRLQERSTILQADLAVNQQGRHEATVYAVSLERARAEKEAELSALQQVYTQGFAEFSAMSHSLPYRLIVRPVWKLRRAISPGGRVSRALHRLFR